ncbi:MAG: hypothetical protein DRJ31_05665 [Candidatus Methanomethylicota archaeon]|uniref:Flagellar protein G n=1 Tax=Thermoproteota archaeon TaxID=2056631 RepID=A0A497EWX5_9CREN|nr:MAG: hypothetical protein DRJ31_05665 [Candidatus Verstraetearchaeota archaeon]RLE51609.1 MAG: hypothetical protein DRJ33_05535 [Candidatus Verstraetearchaeota archaeon]
MSSVTYSESIILIASIIVASLFAGIVLSSMGMIESAYTSISQSERTTLTTKIKVIFADQLDSTTVYVYVKNIGKTVITSVDKVDIYFGKYGSAQYIPYNSSSYPTWNYTLLNNNIWGPNDTIRITVYSSTTLDEGIYVVKVVTPNGVEDEYVFSI